MTHVSPRIIDCTTRGGWPKDLPQEAVTSLISISDVWPLDRFVVEGGLVLEFGGDAYWTLRDLETGEELRVRRKEMKR